MASTLRKFRGSIGSATKGLNTSSAGNPCAPASCTAIASRMANTAEKLLFISVSLSMDFIGTPKR
jgi:hypothetical protein